ncbi:MAG: hypothetical protein ACRD3J_07255, partial [Thermoanaerobaculia bacterium]
MSWSEYELDPLLTQDVDVVVDRGRSLVGEERTGAFHGSLGYLEQTFEPLDRLKVLLFIQSLLSSMPDRTLLHASLAVDVLADVVISSSDAGELKRSALNSLALL